jgi:hypothetical protein
MRTPDRGGGAGVCGSPRAAATCSTGSGPSLCNGYRGRYNGTLRMLVRVTE